MTPLTEGRGPLARFALEPRLVGDVTIRSEGRAVRADGPTLWRVILSAAKNLLSQSRRRMKQYYVYVMTNLSRTLYIGMTSDLARRVHEHKHKLRPGFTSKYNNTRLVYYEVTSDVHGAIVREKELKEW